jgi:hypothetical protein
VAATIAALQTSETSPEVVRLQQRRKIMIRLARYGILATAATVLLVLGLSLLLIHSTAAPTFGQVVENIKKAKSVTFVTKMPTILRGRERGVLRQKFYIQGEHFRMEIPSAQEGADIPARFAGPHRRPQRKKIIATRFRSQDRQVPRRRRKAVAGDGISQPDRKVASAQE